MPENGKAHESEEKQSLEGRPGSIDDPNRLDDKQDKRRVKHYKELMEKDEPKFPCVYTDHEARFKLFSHLPLLKIRKLKKNPRVLNSITGPVHVEHPHQVFSPFVCGRSISTYPHVPGKPKRDGDPVCDSYRVQLLEESTLIAVVTDGCNWGTRPMKASNIAKDAFIDYMRTHQHEINELRDAGHYLLRALSYCHFKIIEGKEDIWEAGTTTLLGGILLRIKKNKEDQSSKKTPEWVFVCVSIGDCKAYHFTAATKQITDITAGNRRNVYDARDSGGRLGPYVGEGQPDLRNVAIYYSFCEEDDLFLLVSDGVHDNLDPQILGISPKEIDPKQYGDKEEWKGFQTDDEVEKIKTQHMLKILSDELIGGGEEDRKLRQKILSFASNDEESPISPLNVTNRIMKHCLAVTGKGREWMEQNPKEKLPMDYNSFPGKMDHATCVVFKVGDFEQELLKLAEKDKKKK